MRHGFTPVTLFSGRGGREAFWPRRSEPEHRPAGVEYADPRAGGGTRRRVVGSDQPKRRAD
ncbi:hypothetical protein D3C81_2160250 [compost metagenome]